MLVRPVVSVRPAAPAVADPVEPDVELCVALCVGVGFGGTTTLIDADAVTVPLGTATAIFAESFTTAPLALVLGMATAAWSS